MRFFRNYWLVNRTENPHVPVTLGLFVGTPEFEPSPFRCRVNLGNYLPIDVLLRSPEFLERLHQHPSKAARELPLHPPFAQRYIA